jgi:hypothetical protein
MSVFGMIWGNGNDNNNYNDNDYNDNDYNK